MEKSPGGYVVYDCDIGNDDAWGLLILIKGEKLFQNMATNGLPSKEMDVREPYKILGITCVQGNTSVDNCAKNAFRVLESVDRLDIPVYKGCSNPILPRTWKRERLFHGQDGFGDIPDLPEVTNTKIQKEHAVNMMYSAVCQYPNKVDFLLVGPLTNFAMCINMYGSDFLDKVRNVWIMGGNYRGKGNITKSAEFNFMMDPEAAHIVLESVDKPVFLLPWESCIDGDMNLEMDWRLNVLGKVDSKVIRLLNDVENAILVTKGFIRWIVCDAVLVAAYCFPQLAITRSRMYHATVELTGTHTRAQMVLDHLRRNKENTCVILEIHKQHYKDIISWAGGLMSDAEMVEVMRAKRREDL
uniref:Inosine/uridine-preferring nucleoside hydrolase domain-containing protein n=1 Tax=Stomoxys calcitrans TaxID=35570 RepID=A0A1I8Q2G7_STOCA